MQHGKSLPFFPLCFPYPYPHRSPFARYHCRCVRYLFIANARDAAVVNVIDSQSTVSLSVSLSVCLSVCLSIPLSVGLSWFVCRC